jgi:hypothetical protein
MEGSADNPSEEKDTACSGASEQTAASARLELSRSRAWFLAMSCAEGTGLLGQE